MNPVSPLGLFYANEPQREAVKEFLIQTLKEMAVEKVFEKASVSGVYEARKLITKAFDKLEEMFDIVPDTAYNNSR